MSIYAVSITEGLKIVKIHGDKSRPSRLFFRRVSHID